MEGAGANVHVDAGTAPLPRLLRAASAAYRDAAREALAAVGCDDVPRNGGFLLASLDRPSMDVFIPQAEAVAFLGLSKQAASQLIDTLVVRGYLERRSDPDDRRRMGLRLTDRGGAASEAIQRAAAGVEGALARRIGAEDLQRLRAGLAALGELGGQPLAD